MTDFTILTSKLKEIFQIDRADLDFGIYRILNSRHERMEHYLTHTLPQIVGQRLQGNHDVQTAVYRHLLTFFSRYYQEGDFISQRRYKGETYAIPYNGEEVLLHWANKDQYYVKSGEHFANYRFKLSDGREVFFKLNAADTAKDNQKDNDAKRFFVLSGSQIDENGTTLSPIMQSDDGQVLTLLFDYQAFPKSTKPEKRLAENLATIFANEMVATNWQILHEKSPTEKKPNRTILEKHLTDYTAKNTADYFIHKDLGGFLNRELDFYIKNEVMNLDDLDNAHSFTHIEHNLRLIQTLRVIAHDIIRFLAQLENFQKRLWEKKKFVADCHYLITLDKIPAQWHDEIFANPKQLAEWQNLYGLANMAAENGHLVVNTALFPAEFQAKLLAQFDDLDEHINGTLIHGDNFQALNLLQAKYQGQVKCIYIDPPYNTEEDREKGDFLYKDSFEKSTWLTMFENRVQLSRHLLNDCGLLACHMDEHEHLSLEYVIKQTFGNGDMGKLIWDKRNPKGDAKGLSAQHEYVHFATNQVSHLDDETAFVRNKANAALMLDKVAKLIKKYGITEKTRQEYKAWLKENKDKLSGGEKAYNQIDDNGNIFRPVSMAWPNKKTAPDEYFVPLLHPVTGKPCPVPARGWRNPPETMKKLLANDLILFGNDETTIPNRKYLLKENLTENVSSLYYMGGSDDELFKNMGFYFDNPKPIQASKYFLSIIARPKNALVLDYFAGSGTTAHAVMNLNREDGGHRRFILVEQGEYFDSILKPRIQKAIFAQEYKNGQAVANKDGQFGGISQMVKVVKLESYEDTLNNLQLQSNDLLSRLPEKAQNDYLLNYMLDIESRASLLNVADFAKPFDYEMNIATNGAGAFVRQKMDLVETFHYLIGARVLSMDDKRHSDGYVAIQCRLPHQNDDEKTLIFWRDCERIAYDELKQMFASQHINPKESHYQEIYINGDHTLDTVWENSEGTQHRLKVKSIEQAFLDLMFGEI